MSSNGSEDSEILRVAREVAEQAGVQSFNPKQVVWRKEVAPGECQFVRRRFKIVVLPKSMVGRLAPEEWRPLLASSMMVTKVPGQGRFVAMMILMMATLLIGLVALSQLLPPFLVQVLGPAVGVPTLIFMLFRLFAWLWKTMLQADIMASRLIGGERLLDVLRKIDSFGLGEAERLKRRRFLRNYRRLSLTDRIENLQSASNVG